MNLLRRLSGNKIKPAFKTTSNSLGVVVFGKYTDFTHDQLDKLLNECNDYKKVAYGQCVYNYFYFNK